MAASLPPDTLLPHVQRTNVQIGFNNFNKTRAVNQSGFPKKSHKNTAGDTLSFKKRTEFQNQPWSSILGWNTYQGFKRSTKSGDL